MLRSAGPVIRQIRQGANPVDFEAGIALALEELSIIRPCRVGTQTLMRFSWWNPNETMNIVTAASLDARTRPFSDLSLKVKLIRGRKGRIKLGLAMGK
jgi:hypothetical protein